MLSVETGREYLGKQNTGIRRVSDRKLVVKHACALRSVDVTSAHACTDCTVPGSRSVCLAVDVLAPAQPAARIALGNDRCVQPYPTLMFAVDRSFVLIASTVLAATSRRCFV